MLTADQFHINGRNLIGPVWRIFSFCLSSSLKRYANGQLIKMSAIRNWVEASTKSLRKFFNCNLQILAGNWNFFGHIGTFQLMTAWVPRQQCKQNEPNNFLTLEFFAFLANLVKVYQAHTFISTATSVAKQFVYQTFFHLTHSRHSNTLCIVYN